MLLVGDGGFFLACEDFGGRFDDSVPACGFLFCFFKWRSARAHQFHFKAIISPQWLSELRRLWTNVA